MTMLRCAVPTRWPKSPAVSSIVLVLDDSPAHAPMIRSALSGLPWPLRCLDSAADLGEALGGARTGCVVAVVGDPDADVRSLQRALAAQAGDWLLILLTQRTGVATAVSALRTGAHDLIELPVVERVLRRRVMEAMRSLEKKQ